MADLMSAQEGSSPPPSPYPGRRAPLPSKVELDLRTACIAVLTNQTPSHIIAVTEDHSKSNAKAQLDYAAIKKSLDKPVEVSTLPRRTLSTRNVDRNLPDTADQHAAAGSSSKFAYKPETAIADLFASKHPESDSAHGSTANIVRRRDEALAADPLHRRTKSGGMHPTNTVKISSSVGVSQDRPKFSQRSASQRSGSHGTNGSTPQTDVTEYPWSTSTAPTSAGITPARNSKRASAHIQAEQDASFKSDTAPMDWIRNELEKRRKNPTTPRSRRPSELERPDPRLNTRPPSRTRSIRSMNSVRSIKSLSNSIKDGIKDYIRPGSGRSASRDRSRPAGGKSSEYERGQATRPPPRRDWRNWGRTQKEDGGGSSSGDVSRSSSVRGRSENRKGSSKAEVNLNRELPPLPSLDQWKEPERERQTHIVNMRSPRAITTMERQAQLSAAISKSSAVHDKDEIVAARLGSPAKSTRPEVYQPTRPHNPTTSTVNAAPYLTTGVAKTTDTDREARDGGVRIEFTIDDLMGSTTATPAHSHSKSTTSAKQSESGSRLLPTPSTRSGMLDGHSRSASSISHNLSFKQSRSHTPVDPSKSTSTLGTTAPSFSKHRKYDKTDIPPALNSNMANQGRKVTNKVKDDTRDPKYRHITEITPPPPVPPKDDKKAWWQLKKQKKSMTWMDQLEKLGIKDGVLLNDEVAGSPIVRY